MASAEPNDFKSPGGKNPFSQTHRHGTANGTKSSVSLFRVGGLTLCIGSALLVAIIASIGVGVELPTLMLEFESMFESFSLVSFLWPSTSCEFSGNVVVDTQNSTCTNTTAPIVNNKTIAQGPATASMRDDLMIYPTRGWMRRLNCAYSSVAPAFLGGARIMEAS